MWCGLDGVGAGVAGVAGAARSDRINGTGCVVQKSTVCFDTLQYNCSVSILTKPELEEKGKMSVKLTVYSLLHPCLMYLIVHKYLRYCTAVIDLSHSTWQVSEHQPLLYSTAPSINTYIHIYIHISTPQRNNNNNNRHNNPLQNHLPL